MRWDRLFTLSVFRQIARVGLPGRESRLPILMYHSVSADTEKGTDSYYRVVTHPRRFSEQMRRLSGLGFVGLPLEEALPMLTNDSRRSDGYRPVVITFDDGFRDFYETAFPLLKQNGHTATMFLPTAFIGEQTRQSFNGRECLIWPEVKDMRAQGIRFGSHTVNHPKLNQLSWREIANELAYSKAKIENAIDDEISGFAYPYAFPQEDYRFTEKFKKTLGVHGYRYCLTTMIGRARKGDDPFRLKRLPVNSCDDQALLTAKLEGAYDWLAIPQVCVRYAKLWSRGGNNHSRN